MSVSNALSWRRHRCTVFQLPLSYFYADARNIKYGKVRQKLLSTLQLDLVFGKKSRILATDFAGLGNLHWVQLV